MHYILNVTASLSCYNERPRKCDIQDLTRSINNTNKTTFVRVPGVGQYTQ